MRQRESGQRLLALVVAGSFALYAVYSVSRWWRYDLDSFDLAVYHQVVWHLSRFEAPALSLVNEPNYFGDHFSPILGLLAPLYWIASSPALLLVAQAALIAASIPPVYSYARRRTGQWPALAIAFAYAQSWGVWAAVDFAVHEVAFAAPLVAYAIDFADRREWPRLYVCLGLLMLVKEDMGLLVVALGILIACRGAWRRGLIVAVLGIAGLVVVNELVIPALNGGEWSMREQRLYGQYGSSFGAIAGHLLTHPHTLVNALFGEPEKVRLLILLVGAFALLPMLGPLSLVAVPLVAERLIASDHDLWAPNYQYSLVTMTILAMASADGLARLERWLRGRAAIPVTLAAAAVVLSLVSAVVFPLNRLVRASYWKQPAAEKAAARLARAAPREASLAADWSVLTHIPPRSGMFTLDQRHVAPPDYLVLSGPGHEPAPRYRLVRQRGGARLYRRSAGR